MTDQSGGFVLRTYRGLARIVLPRRYREVAGDDMVRVAGDLLAEASVQGRVRYILKSVELIFDLVATALAVRAGGASPALADVGLDLRVAGRRLRKSPGYALTVIGILVLGIGVNTSVFQLINGALFAPSPHPTADRLISIRPIFDPTRGPSSRVSPALADDLIEHSSSLEAIALLDDGTLALAADGPAELVPAAWVSTNFFDALGVGPTQGRGFVQGDGDPDAPARVIVSDGLWTRVFARAPDAVGQSIVLEGSPRQIVGILPPDFESPVSSAQGQADVWIPIEPLPGDRLYGATWVMGIGLLRPGLGLQEARQELAATARNLTESQPDAYPAGVSLVVDDLRSAVYGEVTGGLWLLLGAVGLVLVIACANLAGLVLARSAERDQEVAVRSALGAGRGRIARQVFVESWVLAMIGGVGGVALAVFLQGAIATAIAGRLPRLAAAETDLRVIAFALAVSVGTAVLFGWFPAWRSARAHPARALQEGSRGTGDDRRRRRFRGGLVIGQLAVSVALLVGATLLTRTLGALLAVDPGFEAEQALTFEIQLPAARYETTESVRDFEERVLEGLAALPGVFVTGAVDDRPLGTRWGCNGVIAVGTPIPETPEAWPCAESRAATSNYFDAMGIERVLGRTFTRSDGSESPPVVVVNRALAELLWPGQTPLGRQLRWFGDVDQELPGRTVIGVVENVRHRGIVGEIQPEIYMPTTQWHDRRMTYVARTDGDPTALVPSARSVVADIDPSLPLRNVATMREAILADVGDRRLAAALLGALAVLGMLLSLAGVHGAMASLVSRRTREIGVRVTLGAARGEVLRMVLGGSARLALLALAVGLPFAVILGFALQSTLYQVGPLDPISLLAASAAVMCTALAASALPARRALQVDPAEALRGE